MQGTGALQRGGPDRPLKVLHLIAAPRIGGAEKLLLAILDHIDRANYRVAVGIYLDSRCAANALHAELRKREVELFPIVIRSACDLRQVRQLYRCVATFRPDVIHSHGYKTNILGYLVARRFGVPIVSTVHGWLHAQRRVTRWINRLNINLLRRFERVIAVSGQIEGALLALGFSAARLVRLCNIPPVSGSCPVDRAELAARFDLLPQTRTVGFVGRLEPVKGGAILIAAAAKVLERCPDTQFVLAGEGSEQARLEELVERAGLGARVRFLGFVDNPQSVYGMLDLFVLPSLDEGIPLALLEAMAAGIPVIASAVGGVPEVIEDGVNGLLVPAADPALLATAICRVLQEGDEARLRTLAASRTLGERFNVAKWIEHLQTLYLGLKVG